MCGSRKGEGRVVVIGLVCVLEREERRVGEWFVSGGGDDG